MTRFVRLATTSLLAVYALAVFGVARLAGAVLGCSNWPMCGATLAPAGDALELMMQGGVLLAATLAATSVGAALRRFADVPWVTRPMAAAVGVAGFRLALSAVGVLPADAPVTVVVDVATAMAVVGCVLVTLTAALEGQALRAARPAAGRRGQLARPAMALAGAAYALVLTGAVVTATGAGRACPSFPLCDVSGGGLPLIAMTHRATTALVGGLLVWTLYRIVATRRGTRLAQAAMAAAAVFGVQSALGVGNVTLDFPVAVRVLHLAFGALVWGTLVVVAVLAHTTPAPRTAEQPAERAGRGTWRTVVGVYISLMKPRIISLLLVTTWAAMWIAAPEPPSLALMFWTLLGGTLSAGGANALNMYLDRDVDGVMTRTSRRPLPSHRAEPWQALVFGVVLGATSFVLMAVFVNVLSASLALFGLLFYVFVYTRWLKRTSTQNIVIGGAAGAIPPLVGWTAVTGELSLAAVYLFLIIFYWTPPHFWALALVRKVDYARAGIPMLPVVMGDEETRRQIVLYSWLLVALTLILVPLRTMGLLYLGAALVLGGLFIYYAVRLMRDGGHAAAWRLYKYSLLYLALLFVAMVVDHALRWVLSPAAAAVLWP